MALVTGLTADRMLEIEAASVVNGAVNASGNLVLSTKGGNQIQAGRVVGPLTIGLINIWGGSYLNIPNEWFWCNGQELSRAAYPELFRITGTVWGAGNGSTTFNLPDLSGRVPVGMDPNQSSFNARGKTGGANTHTLTVAQMPSHTHTQDAHTHTQNAHTHTQNAHTHTQNAHTHFSGVMPQGGPYKVQNGTFYEMRGASSGTSGSDAGNVLSTTAGNQNTTAVNNNATAVNQNTTAVNGDTGGGAAHNNLQPFLTVNYIIYAGPAVI